jgi:PAS domain S-box-containing protein
MFVHERGKLTPYPAECDSFLRNNILSCGLILPDSTIALGTYRGGMAIINQNGKWLNHLNADLGIEQDDIKNLYVDNSGILWLALNYGICQVNISSPFIYFTKHHSLDGLISSIFRFKNILYAAGSQGVFYLRSANMENPRPQFMRLTGIENEAFSFFSDDQYLLCGTNSGLYQIDGTQVTFIKGENDPIFCMKRSQTDTTLLFAGLSNGLAAFRFNSGKWTFQNRISGVGQEIRSITEQDGNILWLGTIQQGIIRLRMNPSEPDKPLQIERIGSDLPLPYGQLFTFKHEIYFSTENGLKTFNESTGKLIPADLWETRLNDPNRWISKVFSLNPGEFLVHSGVKNRGEYWRIRRNENSVYEVDKNFFRPLLYFGTIYSSYTEQSGIVWFGCNTGIVRYNSNITGEDLIPYQPLVRRVSISPDSLIFGGASSQSFRLPEISYQYNSLRMEYGLPSFTETKDNQYQYLLEGFDRKWSQWTGETQKDYTNLPEGNYSFRLRARDVFANISEGKSFVFEILAPWYRSWWAYASYLMVFVLILVGIDRFQRNRVIRREQQKAKIREAEIVRTKNLELQEINTKLEGLLSSLQTSQAEVKESESRFRSVAESASDAIITADQQGNITFWNQRAAAIFGYTAEKIIGQPLTLLMPERHREAHRNGMTRLVTTGETKISGQVVEIQAIRKSGDEFPIELTVSHWKTGDGIFVTGIIRDITQRKRQEEILEKTRIQLEEAYNHKANELEKARLLQMSMLPSELPGLPHLEMAASMQTAVEVGGDYYDVHLAADQTITLVIGDATGHGLEAGMLVTATKSLFTKLVDEPDIVGMMQQFNESLKRLKLRRLYMTLQIVRIKNYRLQVCTAGMPPLFIYQQKYRKLKEIMLKSLPLGGISGIALQKEEIKLNAGDVVLLLSDGLPERFNDRDEMLDYHRVKSALLEAVESPPAEIIKHLIQVGDQWAGKRALHDDETFVVIKVK